MATSDTRGNDSLRNTGCDGALDDGSDGVHGPDYFLLELRWDVKFDLLEKVF